MTLDGVAYDVVYSGALEAQHVRAQQRQPDTFETVTAAWAPSRAHEPTPVDPLRYRCRYASLGTEREIVARMLNGHRVRKGNRDGV